MMPVKKQAIRDFFKCLFGIHCVPETWAFEDYAAIFAGGLCPRCGSVKYGKFICNTWTGEERKSNGVIMLTCYDVSRATERGYEIRGNIDDLYEEYQERRKREKQKATAR